MRKGMSRAVVKILIGIFLGVVQFSSQDHAIIKPVNAQAIGYDAWGVLLYAFCLWLIISGIFFLFHNKRFQT